MRYADRLALFSLVGLILPGLAALAAEVATRGDADGAFVAIYFMYGAGLVFFSLLRAFLSRSLALVLAAIVLLLGLPASVAVSLGILALTPLLGGIGALVATIWFSQGRSVEISA